MKCERYPVYAVTEAGRVRAIRENMSKVGIAPRAQNFCSSHEEAPVFAFGNGIVRNWPDETGPSGAGIKLVGHVEQWRAAAYTTKLTGLSREFIVGEWTLGACTPRNLVRLWRKKFTPFRIASKDLITHHHFSTLHDSLDW